MALEKNVLIRLKDDRLVRVLWTNTNEQMVVVIEVDNPTAQPRILSRTELLESLASQHARLVEDTYLPRVLPEHDLSAAARRHRDTAWTRIGGLVMKEPDIYFPKSRASLVAKACAEIGGSRPTYYKHLRRYWQYGCVPNALIPMFNNCGAPLTPKKDTCVKRGRPRTIEPGVGTNVNEETRKFMRVASLKRYLGSTRSKLRTAYDFLLTNYYPDDVHIDTSERGANIVTIVNPDKVPTFEQFKYHFHQENNFAAIQINRKGRRATEKLYRPLLNNSQNECSGPGTRYQIDATIIDLYAVSRFDRNRIVGRPTLYLIIDVYSRMIVGFYLGLEPPSWFGAVMALLNTLEDKVALCERYGLDITPDQWPAADFPLKLLGDRGEIESLMADKLARAFNIVIENAAPYRGDAKGVIERTFRTAHTVFGPYTPGYVEPDFRIRGARDYRDDAILTIDEITAIIIRTILIINNEPRRDYQGNPETVKDKVPYAPVKLWKWGKETHRADTRRFDYEYAKTNLLPDAPITLTRRGLRFMKGLYYECDELLSLPWYIKAQENRTKMTAVYHPGDMSSVLIRTPYEPDRVYKATLARHCHHWQGKTLVEIDELRHQERRLAAEYKANHLGDRLGWQCDIEDIVEKARHLAAEDSDPSISRAQRKRDIKKNRAQERAVQTAEHAEKHGFSDTGTLTTSSAPIQSDVDADSDLDFIEQLRQLRASSGAKS